MGTKIVINEQKKRTMEALERRFAAAKAEAQPQVREKRRRDDILSKCASGGSSVGPSVQAPSASVQKLGFSQKRYVLLHSY